MTEPRAPFDMLTSKPRTRSDCKGNARPCSWVSCRYNLLLDVLEDGSIVLNARYRRPDGAHRVMAPKAEVTDRFVDEMDDAVEVWFDEPDPFLPSCALDVADADGVRSNREALAAWLVDPDRVGMQLEEISDLMFVSRERVRQIEASALGKLKTLDDDGNIDLLSLLRSWAEGRDRRA